jgi:uncharacterized membrane protein YccC
MLGPFLAGAGGYVLAGLLGMLVGIAATWMLVSPSLKARLLRAKLRRAHRALNAAFGGTKPPPLAGA